MCVHVSFETSVYGAWPDSGETWARTWILTKRERRKAGEAIGTLSCRRTNIGVRKREKAHTGVRKQVSYKSASNTETRSGDGGPVDFRAAHTQTHISTQHQDTHTHSLWMQSGNIKTHGDEERTQAGTNRSNAEVWGPLTSTAPQFAQLVKVLKRRSWTLLCSS